MIRFWRVGIVVLSVALGASGQSNSRPVKKKPSGTPASQQDIQALRELVQTQQTQIENDSQ